MATKKRPLESDEEVERKLRETKAAWDIVTRADLDRDALGRTVARAMESLEPALLDAAPEEWVRDNQATEEEEVRRQSDIDRYLARCMEHLGILPGVFAEPIASLILNSIDPEYRVQLRSIPQHAVTVERCFAHVDALRLPMRTTGVASLARVTTMALLNTVDTRGTRNVTRVVETGPLFSSREGSHVEGDAARSAVEVVVPAPSAHASASDDQALAPAGRTVVGFVAAKRDSYWVVDGSRVVMKAGEPLLKLAPTASEREKVAERDPQALSKLVVVWWRNAPRRLDEEKVVAVRRSDYLEHLERERNIHAN